MDNKDLIQSVTLNECGNIKPLDESVISFLQVLIPKSTTCDAKDNEPLSYKNCNSFELVYDNRRPQIVYYLGDYMYDAEAKPSRFLSCLPNINFEGTTVGDGGDLGDMYKVCEAIKKWAENTMYLIGEKCVKELEDNLQKEIDEYCEESRKRLLHKLYELGKEQYEKEKYQNINNKPQDNENN